MTLFKSHFKILIFFKSINAIYLITSLQLVNDSNHWQRKIFFKSPKPLSYVEIAKWLHLHSLLLLMIVWTNHHQQMMKNLMFVVKLIYVNVMHLQNIFVNMMMIKQKRNLNLNLVHKILIVQNYRSKNYAKRFVMFIVSVFILALNVKSHLLRFNRY